MVFGPTVDFESFTLSVVDTGTVIDTWKSYHFNSNFLTPTDGFSFTLGDEVVSDDLLKELVPGAKIQLTFAGNPQCTGYIDSVSISSSRGGTEVTIDGRDLLSYVVDACMDPLVKFTANQTLEQVLSAALSPYGFSTIIDSDFENRNVIAGQVKGTPTTKKGNPLKSFTKHQLKPYPSEGVFSFVSRIANRFGLWVWIDAEGDNVIVDFPDFTSDPRYSLIHKRGVADGAKNNVISSSVKRDNTDQPSCIVATGYGTGGEHPRSALTAIAINELTAIDTTGITSNVIQAIINYPQAKILSVRHFANTAVYPQVIARPVYLHDDESKTIEQLQFYARRELSLRQRKALSAKYTVEGHTNNDQPWCTNAMVNVDDDVSNIHEPLYILSRTFIKDRSGGTKTELELIRPYTLEFFNAETE